VWRRVRAIALRAFGLPVAVGLLRVARRSHRGLGVALVYHRVDDPPGDPRRELVAAMGTRLFATQVRHLRSHYRVVAASQLLDATHERRRGEPFPVSITFDDDLATHVEVASPILKSVGATATFYLSGASLREPYRFWWERLQAAVDRGLDLSPLGLAQPTGRAGIHELGRRIQALAPEPRRQLEAGLEKIVGPDPPDAGLRGEGVGRLAAAGVEIGFHTNRHDPLASLDDHELERALQEGRSELEQVVGRPLTTISYPHGIADARVASAARAAGFDAGFTGRPELVTPQSDPLLLGRLSPSHRSLGELAFDVAWALLRGAP
jgi:peptidoglycan/xylan/chitin deacetylase (PgdA/CDA1 family)